MQEYAAGMQTHQPLTAISTDTHQVVFGIATAITFEHLPLTLSNPDSIWMLTSTVESHSSCRHICHTSHVNVQRAIAVKT
jgi:hypothetical protein